MGYFPVRYDSRVLIYERKMFIRLATGPTPINILALKFSSILIGSDERGAFKAVP